MKRLFLLLVLTCAGYSWAENIHINANNDGSVYVTANPYSSARDTLAGTSTSGYLYVGQAHSSDPYNYSVYRSFLSFTIPNMQSVSACTLFVNGAFNYSQVDFYVEMVGAKKYGPTIDNNDFAKFNGWVAGATDTGTKLSSNAWLSPYYSFDWNSMGPFNSAGLDSVFAAKGDTLRIALLSRRDYSNTTPSSALNEYVIFESSANATLKPYLSITYTPVQNKKQSAKFRNKDGVPMRLNNNGTPIKLWSK